MKIQVFETQVFETCESHGYEPLNIDGENDETKPLCYNGSVKARGLFEILYLCGRGDPVKLKDTGFCATCKFYS